MKFDELGSVQAWAYVAGFYEGEGTCGFYYDKWTKRSRLKANIVQSNREILLRIRDFIGFGGVSNGVKSDWSIKNIYQFQISNAKARLFLKKILPYCQHPEKIKQIEDALALDKQHIKPYKKVESELCLQ